MNDKTTTKEQFLSVVRNLHWTAEDKRSDAKDAVESGGQAEDVYKMAGQEVVKEHDPKLYALMVAQGQARKAVHDYVLSHFEGKSRSPDGNDLSDLG